MSIGGRSIANIARPCALVGDAIGSRQKGLVSTADFWLISLLLQGNNRVAPAGFDQKAHRP